MENGHRIKIIGCGPGSPDYLTPLARKSAMDADSLVGSKRLLELFGNYKGKKIGVGGEMVKTLDEIGERLKNGSVAVLVSGDPGICSLAVPVVRRFGKKMCGIIPGVSSVQLAFAAVGMDWLDAKIITAHKSDPDIDIDSLTAEPRIAVLGGRPESIKWIYRLAVRLGESMRIFICERLSLPDEKVAEATLDELKIYSAPPMTVVLLIDKKISS
ncbi:MAG: cobalt-precorrin-7 (C(5))-methyltransferase [bacterium]|nr:MAG: cobalt-precorrin-7 (C(5))-methyltransferase [bacterium]